MISLPVRSPAAPPLLDGDDEIRAIIADTTLDQKRELHPCGRIAREVERRDKERKLHAQADTLAFNTSDPEPAASGDPRAINAGREAGGWLVRPIGSAESREEQEYTPPPR